MGNVTAAKKVPCRSGLPQRDLSDSGRRHVRFWGFVSIVFRIRRAHAKTQHHERLLLLDVDFAAAQCVMLTFALLETHTTRPPLGRSR